MTLCVSSCRQLEMCWVMLVLVLGPRSQFLYWSLCHKTLWNKTFNNSCMILFGINGLWKIPKLQMNRLLRGLTCSGAIYVWTYPIWNSNSSLSRPLRQAYTAEQTGISFVTIKILLCDIYKTIGNLINKNTSGFTCGGARSEYPRIPVLPPTSSTQNTWECAWRRSSIRRRNIFLTYTSKLITSSSTGPKNTSTLLLCDIVGFFWKHKETDQV